MTSHQRDFFVSYTSVDETWASWIAHVLEDAGYSVVIQAWDFRPGSNFVLEMQKALRSADRLIAVLTPAYLQARFPRSEWAAVFAADPEGTKRKLVPVMVEQCEPDGLLAQVVQIRIHDFDEPEAKRRLLAGVQAGRAKPSGSPVFPRVSAESQNAPGNRSRQTTAVAWRRLSSPVNVEWRSKLEGRIPNQTTGYAAVELHLVPVADDARLQVRDLARLAEALPVHGRAHGTFSAIDALDVRSSGTEVVVANAGASETAGLAVTRAGQRSTWAALPRDMLGAVLDEQDLVAQLSRMLDSLTQLQVAAPETVVPAVGIEPAQVVSVGSVSDLPRSKASFGHGMPVHVRPQAEDAVEFTALRTDVNNIAEELAARLLVEHKTAAGLG